MAVLTFTLKIKTDEIAATSEATRKYFFGEEPATNAEILEKVQGYLEEKLLDIVKSGSVSIEIDRLKAKDIFDRT